MEWNKLYFKDLIRCSVYEEGKLTGDLLIRKDLKIGMWNN